MTSAMTLRDQLLLVDVCRPVTVPTDTEHTRHLRDDVVVLDCLHECKYDLIVYDNLYIINKHFSKK